MSKTLKKIITGIQEIFPEMSAADVTPETLLSEIPEWDSIAAVNLQTYLKETFGIEIPLDLLNEETTIGEIVTFIENPDSIKH
jgi:acyl carrier protein